MNSKYKDYLFQLSVVALLALFIIYNPYKNSTDIPTPTEYIQKKKDKKKFKQDRKDWINNMHRSDPDTDWRKLDKETRKEKTRIVNEKRIELNRNNLLDQNQLYREDVANRDITGIWVERGSNNLAGRVRTADIDFENNTIYCASAGGNIWKGTLNGQNWESLTDYMQITGITFLRVIDTDEGQRLLIGSEHNGFYFSDNECLTLTEANGLGNNSVKRFVIQHNTNHIYALVNSSTKAIYRSTDLGETFELYILLNSSQGIPSEGISHFDIYTSRYSEDSIYLLNDSDFYRINNNNLVSISQLPGGYSNDVILTGGEGNLSPFFYAYVGGRIFSSANGGTLWTDKGESPSSWWWYNGFNSSNIHNNRIFVGGMEVFESSNGGNDWSLVNPWYEYYNDIESRLHADIPEIRFYLDDQGNEVALISTDGGLYISDDYLSSVQNISLSGLGVSQYYSTYSQRFYPYAIFAGSQDQGLQKSITYTDGIQDFVQIISGDYGHIVSGDNGISVFTNYPGFTIHYPDIANSNFSMSLDFPGSGYLWIAPLMEDPYNEDQVYLGGGGVNGGNHLLLLTANSSSISYTELSYSFDAKVSAMSYSKVNPSIRYVSTETGSFYYSMNDGQTWNQSINFNGPNAHYFYGSTIYTSPIESNVVYVGGSGYSNPAVYKSENFGQSFTPMHTGLPSTLVFDISGNDTGDLLFAATEVGPYVFDELDNEWYDLAGVSGPDQVYWTVEYIPEIMTARFGTYGRGVWDFQLDEFYNLILGDLNNDQVINIQDIIIIVNFILQILDPTEEQEWSGDLNDDGIIDIIDIVSLLNLILGN